MEKELYLAKPDQTIEEHCERLLKVLSMLQQYKYIEDEHLIWLVRQACIHHDDGKINPEFQKRIRENTFFNPEKEVPHNVLSGFLLNKNEFQDVNDYYRVLFAILYHHNYGNPYEIIQTKKELITFLLKDFTSYKIKRSTLNLVQNQMDDYEAIKVKGYLHKCDYSASGEYVAEYPNNFLEDSMENIRNEWKRISPKSDWNELQKFAMSKRDENVIMIAQTGMGKTEAGLQWIGNHKGFFVLPIRTAINAIFNRIRKGILLDEKISERLSVLYSDSLDYYSQHIENQEVNIFEYEKRGKNLSIPLSISTVDQLFDFVFKYQGYELKLVTLAYSHIVIDEIQMYDPELLAYLIYGLKKIVEFGGKIAIMTATLSPFIKELLLREVPFKEENIKTFVTDLERHNIETMDQDMESQDILNLYYRNKKQGVGNKILVVCNTIKKAQELYQSMKDEMDVQEELHILHSRYIKKDRMTKEKEIIKFGSTYDQQGKIDIKSGIWISTSLVEASLDIDFDYLFTELQDLNSLFQRFGRCNRKGVKDVSNPNCFVYLSSSNQYIDSTLFQLSKEAIQNVHGVLSEEEKIQLLENYMTFDNLKESEYYNGKNGYKRTLNWIECITPYSYEKDEHKLRNILTMDIIPNQIFAEFQEDIQQNISIIQDVESSKLQKLTAKNNILEYSVSIPYWQWMKYKRSVAGGIAENYAPVLLGKYESIPIMECSYNEIGYSIIDYENEIREANIL